MKTKFKKLNFKEVELDYELNYSYQKSIYICIISSYEDDKEDIRIISSTRKELIKEIKSFIDHILNEKKLLELIQSGYRISYKSKKVLKNYRKNLIAYHISETTNRESILKNGLKPNGDKNNLQIDSEEDLCIYLPNKEYDLRINDQRLKKSESLYFHPEFDNYFFYENDFYTNCDLYAVDLEGFYKGIVGSIGLSGFILSAWENFEESNEKDEKTLIYDFNLYNKNSCTIEEYLKYQRKVKVIDKNYGLDEILLSESIGKDKIKLIGTFDENGVFNETKELINFLSISESEFNSFKNKIF